MTGADTARQLLDVCAELGTDELRVLLLVAERLATGRRYGRFDLATDGRYFQHEAVEEVADALVYAACALMRGRTR